MFSGEKNGTRRRLASWGVKIAAPLLLANGCHSIDSESSTNHASVRALQGSAVEQPPFKVNVVVASNEPSAATIVQAAKQDKGDSGAREVLPPPKPIQDPAPKPESENTIDLAAAFQLAGIDNPTINLAREATREALARQQFAQALMLPNLSVGSSFHMHRGNLQSGQGTIRDVDRQDLYAGAGARAIGSQTVGIPGVRLFSHLGDAIYEPLAARQNVEARRSISTATENQVLLAVAGAYFDLVGAEVRLEAMRKSETDLEEVNRLTAAYAKRGQGRVGDAHRAEANLELLHRQIQDAEEQVAAASARLSGLLSLDPTMRLHTPGGILQPLTLIDEKADLATLIENAMMNRPEVRARLQQIAEARTRVRQEKVRPFLPLLSVGYSAGTFGGGSNLTAAGITQTDGSVVTSPSFGRFDGRSDFDVFAVWTLRNAGAGNRAVVWRTEALTGQAIAALEDTRNEIRREISEALADAQSAARQIDTTREQLRIAEEGFREEMTRIKQVVGRPLETIDSFRQLLDARQEILAAVIAYNAAQYRLLVAVGFSPLHSPEACHSK